MMTLEELFKNLRNDSFEFLLCSNPHVNINGIKMLTPQQSKFEPDVLYFGSTDLLPKSLEDITFLNALVYLGHRAPPFFSNCQNCNCILLKNNDNPFFYYNFLQDYFIASHRQTPKIRQMLSAFLSNKGLQYLIDEAATVLENPILVTDPSYKYIALNPGNLSEDNCDYVKILKEELKFNSILEEGINYIKQTNLNKILGGMDKPYIHYNDLFKLNTMISSIKIHNIEVAHLAMVEKNHKFTQDDYECFVQLSYFVAQEMEKNINYNKNKGQQLSHFLIDLLDNPQPNRDIIERRLKNLNYNKKSEFFMAIIKARDGMLTNEGSELMSNQMQDILANNIYAFYENSLVILFNQKEGDSLSKYIEETLAHYAYVNNLKVGISNAFYDLADITRFYQQAKQAVNLAEKYVHKRSEQPLYYYRDYAYLDMLEVCHRKSNLMNFCHPSLLRLMEYDERTNSEMMDTLYEYLENAANTQRTADALYIHKNTLLYRLARIKSIIGNDLKCGEDLFMFHLSFRILIYLGFFKPKQHTAEMQNENEESRDILDNL